MGSKRSLSSKRASAPEEPEELQKESPRQWIQRGFDETASKGARGAFWEPPLQEASMAPINKGNNWGSEEEPSLHWILNDLGLYTFVV